MSDGEKLLKLTAGSEMAESTLPNTFKLSILGQTKRSFNSPLFLAKSIATLFSANHSVDAHRDIYAQIRDKDDVEPLNREEELPDRIREVLRRRSVGQPDHDLVHPYWNPAVEYDPLEIFGALVQFLDYHRSQVPATVLPPEEDVERYINTVFQNEGPVTIDWQLNELLKITGNNLVGAVNLGFVASRFMGRGMDTRGYPKIPVTDERMLSWGQKMAQFELHGAKGDSTGDTYYFWTHVFAALFFNIYEKNKFIYQTTFEHGTEIMKFVRRWIARLPITSDHREASLLGRNVGLALSEPDWYFSEH